MKELWADPDSVIRAAVERAEADADVHVLVPCPLSADDKGTFANEFSGLG